MTDRRSAAPDPARLAALVAAYGADPERWPAADRPLAAARLSASPADHAALRAAVAEAAALDRLLAAVPPPPPPSPALRATILHTAAAKAAARGGAGKAISGPAPGRAGWPAALRRLLQAELAALGWGWRPAGAVLASALLAGVVAGNLSGGVLAMPSGLPTLAMADEADEPDLMVAGFLTPLPGED